MANTLSGTPIPTPIVVSRCEQSWDPELEVDPELGFDAELEFAVGVVCTAVSVAVAIAALADEMRAISASCPGRNAKPERVYVKLVAQQLRCGVSAKDSQQNVVLYTPGVPQA
jgi:hypothetical protein